MKISGAIGRLESSAEVLMVLCVGAAAMAKGKKKGELDDELDKINTRNRATRR